MICYEITEGILVPMENSWNWVPIIWRLHPRYDVIVLKGVNHAFLPYRTDIDLDELYFLIKSFENGNIEHKIINL